MRQTIRSMLPLLGKEAEMDFWSHVERVMRVSSVEELQAATGDFTRASGFKHHGYAMKARSATPDGSGYFYFHDFRRDWGATYSNLDKPKAEEGDSRIQLSRLGMPAGAWNCRGRTSYPSVLDHHPVILRARGLLGHAGECGLRSGITVPIFSPGLKWAFVTFTHDYTTDPREMRQVLTSSLYFVSCLQMGIDRLCLSNPPTPTLSGRELEVLRWCAAGKTSWEISIILGISERTVNFHTARAARKLKVNCRQAACVRAVALGLISP